MKQIICNNHNNKYLCKMQIYYKKLSKQEKKFRSIKNNMIHWNHNIVNRILNTTYNQNKFKIEIKLKYLDTLMNLIPFLMKTNSF